MERTTAVEAESIRQTNLQRERVDTASNSTNDKNSADDKEYYSFYIFANRRSGSAQGHELCRLNVEKMVFSVDSPKPSCVEINIYDISDPNSRSLGMMNLKQEQQKGKRQVRVIPAGGDGTVMWVVQELQNYGVDLEKCPIGVIPLGTGNHFSRILGWGKDKSSTIKGMRMGKLRRLALSWLDSKIEDYDIWDVSIECEAGGGIYEASKIKGKTNTRAEVTDTGVKLTAFTRKLANYFSIGFGAKTGYDFEKYRTKSRYKNLFVYCFTGMKHTCSGVNYINNFIESIERICPEEESKVEEEKPVWDKDFVIYPKLNKTKTQLPPEGNKNIIDLHQKLAVLAFLNVPHYATGSNIWDSNKAIHKFFKEQNMKKSDFCEHKTNDDLLEIVGYDTPIAVTLGRAHLLWQSKAPLVIKFKASNQPLKPLKVHFEIDGEYFEAVNPKKATITRSTSLRKIKVMYNALKKK